jgi:hypothetical protein
LQLNKLFGGPQVWSERNDEEMLSPSLSGIEPFPLRVTSHHIYYALHTHVTGHNIFDSIVLPNFRKFWKKKSQIEFVACSGVEISSTLKTFAVV